MITIAIHTMFVWILAMTMQAKTVPHIVPKPEIRQEQKAPEPAVIQIVPEAKPPIMAPL